MSDEKVYAPEDYTGPKEFVHLHNHTVFSTLDGVSTPEQYAMQCKEFGYPAMSATEHGHMGSVPDMLWAFKKVGLKYIPGCEIYWNDYEPMRRGLSTTMKKLKEDDPALHANVMRNRHLTILAKNEVGFSNLIKLTTQAHQTGYYYRPRIWFDKLCEYKEGLIVLSGCLNGPICHELRHVDPDGKRKPRLESSDKRGAVDWVRKFKEVFGEDYLIELQMPGVPDDEWVFRQLVALADHFKLRTVLANDCWNKDLHVQTSDGCKKLCDVRVGDMVWTHRGRLREVVQVGKRKRRDGETMYGFIGSAAIQCTDNHKLLSSVHGVVAFREIGKLTVDDEVAITRIKLPNDDLGTIKTSDYLTDRRCRVKNGMVFPLGGRTINPIPDVLELTDDCLWMMGMYLSEGYVDSYRLAFAHHVKESEYYIRLCKYFTSFGFTPDLAAVSDNGVRLRICSSGFSYLLQALMGKRAYCKKLPPFWTRLSQRQLLVFLRGYFDGDGCRSRKSFFTTSIAMFTGLIQAFAAVGLGVTPRRRPSKSMVINNKKRGKIKTFCKEGYSGSVGKIGLRGLGYDVDYDTSKIRRRWRLDGDYIWLKNPFRPIESDIKEVWCIEVEDDHSFLMGMTSSNCHYLYRRDFLLQKIMMAIDQKKTVDDPTLFHVNSDEQYMKTRGELWSRFKNFGYSKGVPDSVFESMCDNTLWVADRCTTPKFDANPKYPSLADADNQLAALVAGRIKERGLHKIKKRYLVDGREVTYVEQASIELERIVDKGYSSYFLITYDLLRFGREEKHWPFSPRGCTIPSALVKMADGTQCPIVDVTIGDVVKDGFDDDRIVENKFVYDISEDLVEIEFDGGILSLTSDHKLYVVRDGVVMLLRAGEIVDSDEIIATDSGERDNHEDR